MPPAISDSQRAAARDAFGSELDQLLAKYQAAGVLTDADLTAALEGRADRVRSSAASRQQAERADLARYLAADREMAVGTLGLRVGLPAEVVSDMLRGDATKYDARRSQVLGLAANYPALVAELAALRRAEAARRPAVVLVPTPLAVTAPVALSASQQPLTIGGK